MSSTLPPTRPIRIGVSACLLGERVRFDGGHKHDGFLTGTLGQYVEWVPVCPEVEVGLGTPREAIHLIATAGGIRLVGTTSGRDHTDAMRRYARARVAALADMDLCGYVFKKDSPSCGVERVRIHHVGGRAAGNGRGLFAEELIAALPSLPVEEEGRLCDPRLRENWIERVFAYRRLKDLWATRWRLSHLVAFHAAHKLTVLAHSPRDYARLGRLVGEAKRVPRAELRARYERELMAALAKPATRARHVNVLQHIAGYFRDRLDEPSRGELAARIDDYRVGIVPLVVPHTLARHYVRVFDVPYLQAQLYLNPDPKELALRNHV